MHVIAKISDLRYAVANWKIRHLFENFAFALKVRVIEYIHLSSPCDFFETLFSIVLLKYLTLKNDFILLISMNKAVIRRNIGLTIIISNEIYYNII